jgi:hypothetical protein
MRYTVTFQVDIQAESDQHALSKAELIASRQNAKYTVQDWSVSELHQTPFASLVAKKVDINKIKYGKT